MEPQPEAGPGRKEDVHEEQSNDGQDKPPKRGPTFRVRGVPLAWTRDKLQNCLAEEVAEQGDPAEPLVHSLAREIHGRSCTATVTFQNASRQLRTLQDGESWQKPLATATNTFGQQAILALDHGFLGITTLYAPPLQDHGADIVAIAGLGGHAFESFKESCGVYMWLRDALPYHLIREREGKTIARVMLFGYESSLYKSESFQNLEDIASALLPHLRSLAVASVFRPTVFIAHSLGGLIIKQALIFLSKSNHELDQRLVQAVYGIAFFGVPHEGMDISSVVAMVGDEANRYSLKSIESLSSQILSIQQRELPGVLGGQGVSEAIYFHETRKSPTVIQNKDGRWDLTGSASVLVTKSSATHCRPWETGPDNICSIDRTHSEMVKFGPEDDEYEKALERISGLVRRALVAQAAQAKSTSQPILSQEEQACLRSLAFSQMYDRANDIDYAATGTCEWLLRHRMYTSWDASNRGLLWIKGKPGSGKSTLLKYALKNQRVAPSARCNDLILSFFFHDRGDNIQKSPLGFFRAVVHQALGYAPTALSDLVDEFQKRCGQMGEPGQKWHWHEEELQLFFESSLPKLLETHSIGIFVDALDECGKENAVKLLRWFKKLLRTLPTTGLQCRICVTCRHYPILDQDCGFEICPEHENTQDISTYVQGQLSTSSELAASSVPALVTLGASGVFMWARLVVNQVLILDSEGVPIETIEQEARNNPPELDELYWRLVKGMNEKQASLRLIQWICFATRPLTLNELGCVMDIGPEKFNPSIGSRRMTSDYLQNIPRLKRRVQSLSCGLAEIIPSSGSDSGSMIHPDSTTSDRWSYTWNRSALGVEVVQFIHQSVKDFFIDKGLSALNDNTVTTDTAVGMAHFQLSRICILYLAMDQIKTATQFTRGQMQGEFPLLDYATRSWVSHIKQSDARDIPQEDLLGLFDWPSNIFMDLWIRIYQAIDRYSNDCPCEQTSLVHLIARYDILGVLNAILDLGGQSTTDLDAKDSFGRTPLSIAAEQGHETIVTLLLETDQVDINSKDSDYGQTPLSHAVEREHETIVTLLLETGQADVNSQNKYGWTPLSYAAQRRNEVLVTLLLETGQADVNLKDEYGWSPLSHAVQRGHETIVTLLLEIGQADVNSQDRYGWTPLSHAAQRGNKALVALLLKTGQADINFQDKYGGTPLSHTAGKGDQAIFALLLETGLANVNLQDGHGQTPLSHAAENGNEAIVILLLETGQADINSKDESGQTPSSYAAMGGHRAVVELLERHAASYS